jgi:hypothetical protein
MIMHNILCCQNNLLAEIFHCITGTNTILEIPKFIQMFKNIVLTLYDIHLISIMETPFTAVGEIIMARCVNSMLCDQNARFFNVKTGMCVCVYLMSCAILCYLMNHFS